MTDKILIVPQYLVPALMVCDGTHDQQGIQAAVRDHYGIHLDEGLIDELVQALDEALLLENDHFAEVQGQLLTAYRQAPSRPPAFAGRSYPEDPQELRTYLQRHLDAVVETHPPLPSGRGLVSPHIDYHRGAPVYAAVWKHVAEAVKAADLVVMLGTDHYGANDLITLTRQNYATPYGVLPTALDVVDALAEAVGGDAAFQGELRHRGEHSIELATVWLHHLRDGEPCEMVPILTGSFGRFMPPGGALAQDVMLERLVSTFQQVTAGRRVLVVAAGDLAHVGPAFQGRPYRDAERHWLRRVDQDLISHICGGDAQGFFDAICKDSEECNVCGTSCIYLALRFLGQPQGRSVAYDQCLADDAQTSWVSICGIALW